MPSAFGPVGSPNLCISSIALLYDAFTDVPGNDDDRGNKIGGTTKFGNPGTAGIFNENNCKIVDTKLLHFLKSLMVWIINNAVSNNAKIIWALILCFSLIKSFNINLKEKIYEIKHKLSSSNRFVKIYKEFLNNPEGYIIFYADVFQ